MKLRSTTFAIALLFLGAGLLVLPGDDNTAAAQTATVRFGMDAESIKYQTANGVKPDYGTIWVGPWTLKHGWAGTDKQLDEMRQAGVTPVIHLYYWGDDISRSCIEYGCYSSLHTAWKDKAGWDRLTRETMDHINARMGGKPVIVLLETEFNKGDVVTYEPLDGYLASKAGYIKSRYWNVDVVLPLGNWGHETWYVWDRAAGSSDAIGIQAMRGSTRDSYSSYMSAYESSLMGVKKAKSQFGKPVMIHDVALSSYPDSTYLQSQADSLREFFTNLPTLKANGVNAIIYRAWANDPHMDLANYYGVGERHWGLLWTPTGAWKPSAKVWVDGVRAERAGSSPTAPDTGSFSANFAPSSSVNEWWVDVSVKGTKSVSKVEMQVNGGSWTTLPKSSWGTWAKSTYVAKGSSVVFKATAYSGETATSTTYSWLGGSASGFTANFAPSSSVNEWWVDVSVKGSKTVTKVEMKVNGGSWTTLPKTSWGTWAKSTHVAKGANVVFKATASSGETATSTTYKWLGGGAAGFTAAFVPKSQSNDWWIETSVKGSESVTKVEVRLNNGAWTTLPKTSWGTYAKSVDANGKNVQFRAWGTSGNSATSTTYMWG